MCCPLDKNEGTFYLNNGHLHDHTVHIKGTIDFTPQNFSLRVTRFFQRMELFEKTLELFDEGFHATAFLIKRFASARFYEFTNVLHTSAHEIEHFLHSISFYGDIARLSAGTFFEYHDSKKRKIDLFRSLSRIFYAVSHFFSHIELLKSLEILKTNRLDKVLKYKTALTFAGHSIWVISLIWRNHILKSKESNFLERLNVYLAGCAYEGLELARNWKRIQPYKFYLSRLQALAGMAHAWSVISLLLPEKQKINIKANLENNTDGHHHHHHNHHHHHHHHA